MIQNEERFKAILENTFLKTSAGRIKILELFDMTHYKMKCYSQKDSLGKIEWTEVDEDEILEACTRDYDITSCSTWELEDRINLRNPNSLSKLILRVEPEIEYGYVLQAISAGTSPKNRIKQVFKKACNPGFFHHVPNQKFVIQIH